MHGLSRSRPRHGASAVTNCPGSTKSLTTLQREEIRSTRRKCRATIKFCVCLEPTWLRRRWYVQWASSNFSRRHLSFTNPPIRVFRADGDHSIVRPQGHRCWKVMRKTRVRTPRKETRGHLFDTQCVLLRCCGVLRRGLAHCPPASVSSFGGCWALTTTVTHPCPRLRRFRTISLNERTSVACPQDRTSDTCRGDVSIQL